MNVIDSEIKTHKSHVEISVKAKIFGHVFIFRKAMTATRIGYNKELEKMKTIGYFGEAMHQSHQQKTTK